MHFSTEGYCESVITMYKPLRSPQNEVCERNYLAPCVSGVQAFSRRNNDIRFQMDWCIIKIEATGTENTH